MFVNLNNHQITKSNKFHVRISLDNCLVSKSQHKTNQLDCSRQQNKQNRKSFKIITSFIIAKKSKVEKSPRYFKRVIIVENFRATAQFNKPHNILKHPQIHLNSLKGCQQTILNLHSNIHNGINFNTEQSQCHQMPNQPKCKMPALRVRGLPQRRLGPRLGSEVGSSGSTLCATLGLPEQRAAGGEVAEARGPARGGDAC